jgi:16S rRNA (cytidine1402-2'-O)-methyltransferase
MSFRGGTLYLLPTLLADTSADAVLPAGTLAAARAIDYLLAENAKSARAFLKAIAHPKPVAGIHIVEVGHTPDHARIDSWLKPLLHHGIDAAIVSEAGCPGIADPGASIVARAHALGIKVRPLVGPSSLLLALMASGLNGQQFRFVGYLPRDAAPLAQRLREIERDSERGETQIFIETPYRNERLLAAILATCHPTTRLSIAVDLTTVDECLVTRTVREWSLLPENQRPCLDRHPAVFSLLAVADRGAEPRPGSRAKRSGRQ